MKNNLLENLKILKSIEPDSAYSKKSLNLILSQNRIERIEAEGAISFTEWIQIHRVLITSGFAGVLTLVLVILTAISYLPGNKNSMVAEANDINNSIQIRLDEIKYQLNKPISSSMINEIQNSLAKAVEELSAAKDLNVDDSSKLKEALDKIKNTRDILVKINSQLAK